MPNVPLCCDNLGELNHGLSRGIIDKAITDAVNDLEDRAEFDGKPRKVVIELTMNLMNNGDVSTYVEAHAKTPKRRTRDTVHQIRRSKDGQELMFSLHSPERPDQKTIMDHTGDAAAEGPADDDDHGRRADRR